VYLYYGKLPSKSYREVKSIIQSQGEKFIHVSKRCSLLSANHVVTTKCHRRKLCRVFYI